MESNGMKLKVLSLNCWGLKYIAAKRTERIKAIGEWLLQSYNSSATSSSSSIASSSTSSSTALHSTNHHHQTSNLENYNLICLQEIWVKQDFDHLASIAKSIGLPYSKFFYSGSIGSGLAILSSFPILDSFIHHFTLSGHPLHIIEGDFYASKSICGITVKIPGLGLVDVLNTHLYAPGGEGESVEGAHRIAQAWELSRIVRERKERGRTVILMGDLNSQPHSLIIRLIVNHSTLYDVFSLLNLPPPSLDSEEHHSLSAEENMKRHGITCDSPLNSWSIPKLKGRERGDEVVVRGGKRLDYILFTTADTTTTTTSTSSSTSTPTPNLYPLSLTQVLTSLVPSTNYSYSDHFGLSCLFSIPPPTSSSSSSSSNPPLPEIPPLSESDLQTSISLLSQALSSSLSTSLKLDYLFFSSLLLIPFLVIGASFQPFRSLNWIFVLLGVGVGIGGVLGVVGGTMGGGGWERAGLKGRREEMKDWLELWYREGVEERGEEEELI